MKLYWITYKALIAKEIFLATKMSQKLFAYLNVKVSIVLHIWKFIKHFGNNFMKLYLITNKALIK